MANYTKAQAKRAMKSIMQKRNKLYMSGFLTDRDLFEFSKIIERFNKRMK